MDRVLRHYAHTAWTASDPLQELAPEVRRAILLTPSTFRERLRLAPWRGRDERRLAIGEIIAERRLMYELNCQQRRDPPPEQPANAAVRNATPSATSPTEPGLSPYYAYRVQLDREAMAAFRRDRQAQDLLDRADNPEAREDHARRANLRDAQRKALLEIDLERARLRVKELEVLAGADGETRNADQPAKQPSQPSGRARRRERDK